MKKLMTLIVCVLALGLGALLGYWLSAGRANAEPDEVRAVDTQAADTQRSAGVLPPVVVYRSPTCGCCGEWVTHMRRNGFPVEEHEVDDVDPFKQRAGITPQLASCHTAFVDGYALEGHVPAADIKRLLSERPAGRGLAVPGMPLGSPGMEVGDRRDAYDVLLFRDGGDSAVFSHHSGQQ